MKPKIQKRKAFTLVEILIVICVISILFVVLVSRVDFATDKARQAGVQNDMHALQYAIHQVAVEKGELVDDLNLLASLLNENLDTELMVRVEGNMLKTHATDPWGNEYQLRYNKGIDNKGQLQVLSAGPDSDYSTNDDTVIAIVCSQSASGINVVVKNDVSSDEIIREDGTLPNQPEAPEHVCSFNRRVQSAQFLKTAGNCKTESIYFYSCECGAVGTATFTGSKNPSEHVANPTITYNSYNDEQHTTVTTCVGCNIVLDTTDETHNFSNNVCTKCRYERHVHSYVVESATEANKATSATCSVPATYYYTCECGAKSTNTFTSGNTIAHNYTGRVTTEPTCTTTGVRTYTCSSCGDSRTEQVDMVSHNFNKRAESTDALKTPATCKDYAVYYYSCSSCNTPNKNGNTFNGSVLADHSGGTKMQYEYIDESKHYVYEVCNMCNKTLLTTTSVHGNLVNNKCSSCKGHVHSFTRKVENDTTRITNATCTTYATYRYSCADTTCNALGDINNPFSGNQYAAHIAVNGKTENVHTKCSVCGTTISSTHSYGTPVITKDATCTTTGTQEKTCTCGYVKTESVTALGHDIVSHSAKTATCTSIGWNAYDTCNRCTYSTYQEVAMKSHTSTNGGTQAVHEKCSICGKTLNSNHSYTKTTTKVATCAETGLFTYTCKCGYKYTETVGKLSDHLTTTTQSSKRIGLGATGHITDTICTICNKTVDSVEESHVYNNDTCTKCGFVVSTISGKWIIKTTPNFDGIYHMIWEPVTFTSNNIKYTSIRYGFDGGDGHFIAYMTDENSTSVYDTYNNRWTNDAYKVIDFGTVEQQVSQELHDWLIENATQQVYSLSGTWKFNDILTSFHDERTINITFNSNNQSWTAFFEYNDCATFYYKSGETRTEAYNAVFKSWSNENYKTLNFGSEPQTVSKEFYEWFISNASPYVDENGTNLAPGLYQTGTNTMIYSWQYLLDHEYVFVENGILTTLWDEADGENGSEYVLDGDLIIPNNGSVTELGEYAFRMCYNLTGITIPNTVTEIGAMAFEGISADSITIPSSVKDLGFAVFAYSNFKEIILEEGIKTIGCGTFMDMWSLETLTLPSTITTIGDHAFARNQFTTLYLPNSIRTIDYNAFLDCNNLTTIYYNDYVMNMLYYVEFADDWNMNMPEVNIVCLDRTTPSNSMFAHGHIAGFYEFDPDMTWEEWITSNYNDGQYIVYNNEIYTYDLRYKLVDSSSGTTVKKSDKVKSMRRYTVIDMNPNGGHSAGGGN